MSRLDDAAGALLARALEQQLAAVPESGPILGLHLRPGPWQALVPAERLVVLQPWQPHAAALGMTGATVVARAEQLADILASRGAAPLLALAEPHQGRVHTLGLIATGLGALATGGSLVVAMPNTLGPASFEKTLRKHVGPVEATSKFKGRAFALQRPEALPSVVTATWPAQAGEQVVVVGERNLATRAGLFSADAADPASQMLLQHLPAELGATVADLGCGWGLLSEELLRTRPGIQRLHLVDANAEALALAERNCAPVAGPRLLQTHWSDVSGGLPQISGVDSVAMNPPFHDTGATEVALGQAFIRSAAQVLKPGGWLYMVANRQLPYEAVLERSFAAVDPLVEQDGFKVIAARKADR